MTKKLFIYASLLVLSACITQSKKVDSTPLYTAYLTAKTATYERWPEHEMATLFTERSIEENRGEWPESWHELVFALDDQMLTEPSHWENTECLVVQAKNEIDDTTTLKVFFQALPAGPAIDGLSVNMKDKNDNPLFEISSSNSTQYECPDLRHAK